MGAEVYGLDGAAMQMERLPVVAFEDFDAFAFPPSDSVPMSVQTTKSSPDFQDPLSSTSTSTSPPDKAQAKPRGRAAAKSKGKTSAESGESDSAIKKRTLNTLAARRYRQKRLDRMEELEAELAEARRERDEFKVRCARLEGEVGVMRGLLGK